MEFCKDDLLLCGHKIKLIFENRALYPIIPLLALFNYDKAPSTLSKSSMNCLNHVLVGTDPAYIVVTVRTVEGWLLR